MNPSKLRVWALELHQELQDRAMSVHDVPRARWEQVLEAFSCAHRGWLACVVTVRPGPEVSSRTGWRPLEWVNIARTGRQAATIRIRLQGGPTVVVRAPRTLGVDRREDGAECGLEVDAAGGEFVRLAFRATALSEELDGIAPAELAEPREASEVRRRQGESVGQSCARFEGQQVSK